MSTPAVQELTKQWPENLRVSQSFLTQIEQGATPSPYKLLSLSRIYKVPLSDFFRAIGATDGDFGGTISLEATSNSPCPDSDPEHVAYHRLLEIILHGERKDADVWRQGIISALEAMSMAAISTSGSSPSEKKYFSPLDEILPTDRARPKDPEVKRKRK